MIAVSAKGEQAERMAWQVHDLLAQEQGLRTTTSDIVVEASEGLLKLKGRVRTNLLRNLAQRRAQIAANGWQLQNNLISDEAIALALASKLALDPRTAGSDIRTKVYLGTVYLKGFTQTLGQRAAAVELANAEAGVRGVEDLISIRR